MIRTLSQHKVLSYSIGISALLFAVFSYVVNQASEILIAINQSVFEYLIYSKIGEYHQLWRYITDLGGPVSIGILTIAATVYFCLRHSYRIGILYSTTIVSTFGIVMYLKTLFAFERPVYEQAIETTFSYPSGHTAISAVFLIVSSYIYTHNMHTKHRKVCIAVAIGISVLIAVSRLFLGEHWLSDIVGAYLLAALCSSTAILLFESHIARKPLQDGNA